MSPSGEESYVTLEGWKQSLPHRVTWLWQPLKFSIKLGLNSIFNFLFIDIYFKVLGNGLTLSSLGKDKNDLSDFNLLFFDIFSHNLFCRLLLNHCKTMWGSSSVDKSGIEENVEKNK